MNMRSASGCICHIARRGFQLYRLFLMLGITTRSELHAALDSGGLAAPRAE
jgi:hypothetical protein